MEIDQENAEKALKLFGDGIKDTMKGNITLMKINNGLKKKFKVKVKEEEAPAEAEDEYEKLDPLDKGEIYNALKIIDELHPMKNTPLFRLFPTVCCFLKYRKKTVNVENVNLLKADTLSRDMADVDEQLD